MMKPEQYASRGDIHSNEKPVLSIAATCPKEPYKINDDILIPASINQYLRNYQRDGVSFLYQHLKNKTGCILADDMGLGKTIQVISFFAAVMRKTGSSADALIKNRLSGHIFLVVAPTSVLYNWMDELETWGYFRVGKFHRQNKEDVMNEVHAGKLEILMTTHETMRIHIETLNVVKWTAVIFDEAHKIKQPLAQITVAAKQLKSYCKIGLTGTPLQNDLNELWCLLDWANPGCLGTTEDFDEKFARPIYIGQRYNSNKRELATARKKQQELNMLHRRWMLRRTKEMIQNQLPMKDEKIVFCSLSLLQVSIYEAVLKLPKVKRLLELDIVCKCGSDRLGRKCCLKNFNWRKWLFPYIQILLKTSNHAALLLPHHNQSAEQKKMCQEICECLFEQYPMLQDMYKHKKFSQMSDPAFCGKMAVLQKLLVVLYKKKDKVLLFSHSTQLLNILEAYVMSRGMIYRRLDGGTPAEKRNLIVKEFNADANVFICLLSTTAGSLGLNLTGANFVIIFDPLWNPTYDQQAQDRAYRIGQQRDVFVYRFISVGTIEENIYMRQIYKQQLANIAINTSNERRYFAGVAGDKRYRGELFGIANMFKFSANHNSIFAKQTFEKVKQVENGVSVAKYEGEIMTSEKQNRTVEEPADDYAVAASQCIDEESTDDGDDDPLNFSKDKVTSSDDIINPPFLRKDAVANLVEEGEIKTAVKSKEGNNSYNNVLVDCGVQFAHSIKSIVGSSAREQKLSKQAMKDVFWDGLNSQLLANDAGNVEQNEESEEIIPTNPDKVNIKGTMINQQSSIPCRVFERVGSDMFIIGCTPPAIQAKHFSDIAKQTGYHSVTELAQYLSTCITLQMNKILKKFYLDKEPSIRKLSLFNQIYDCKESVRPNENISSVKTGKSQQKKTSKSGCIRRENKLIRRRPKYKDLNWHVSFQNEEPKDEINEYATDEDEGFKDTENVTSTPLFKCEDKGKIKFKLNKIKSSVVSLVTLSERQNEICKTSTGITDVNDRTFLKVDNSDQCFPPEADNIRNSNQKSNDYSVIDELLFSPTIPNDKNSDYNRKKGFKSESNYSDTDISLENLLNSVDNTQQKIYDHSLDELLNKSCGFPCSTHSKTGSKCRLIDHNTSLFHSETNYHGVTDECEYVVTMETDELSKYINKMNNKTDLSVLDELLGPTINHSRSVSPRKKSKHENENKRIKMTQSSIIDEFIS